MPKPDTDEATLVDCAIAGDAKAFGELYMLHLDAIYRYIYFRIGDGNDAEDLTEQVFLNAWEALPGYSHRGTPFTSWLYRIAHNIVVDHHRRRKAVEAEAHMVQEVYRSEEEHALNLVIEFEESASLANAIAQLPEDQQQVIILRFIEGLNHGEISRIMDKTEGACRMIQHRALVALNQLMRCAQGR